MRRGKRVPTALESANITQVRCRCEASEELQRRNEERERLLSANRQLAASLNAAKCELVTAKKNCARADILMMQYHVEQVKAQTARPIHNPPLARQDASVQCDLTPMSSKGTSGTKTIVHHAHASSKNSPSTDQYRPHMASFLKKRAAQRPSSMGKPPDGDLVVTKKALREHKLVVYKEPSAKVKLRQSTLPMYAATTSNNAMNTVQQTPPRKRTFKQQPPPLVSNSPTRDNELSAELAGLLHACDVEEENSPRSSFTKQYTSINETFRSMRAPGSPAGSNAEPAAKKHRVTRRGTSIPEYKEISLSRKMRQGDRYSFHTYFK